MKCELWMIGKTSFSWLEEGISLYKKRLAHYISFQIEVIPDVKSSGSLPTEQLKQKEAEQVLKRMQKDDLLVLLDERGKKFSSVDFAGFLEKETLLGRGRRIIFLVGGAYGFHTSLYDRAQFQLSLSEMTFSHQMVRLFFVEQLYRAMTIIRGESYHND